MNGEVFGPAYAAVYDALYRDKDYPAEAALIERLLFEYAGGPVRKVLDLGCGSGNHVLPLIDQGFAVTGVDRSESMLAQARAKSPGTPFIHADIRTCELKEKFDAVLMMFAVLGYQTETADAKAALHTARRHLNPGGVFLFDFWYGPAVIAQLPGDRIKTMDAITRTASSTLDASSQTCRVEFRVSAAAEEPFSETHTVRFFFADELERLLAETGFRLLRLASFPDTENGASPSTWNVLAIAVAQ